MPRSGLRRCGSLAAGVTMETASGTVHQNLKRLDEPVYRFDDPARRTRDGTMWVWCDSGRPYGRDDGDEASHRRKGGHHWLTELTSLAPGPFSATIEGIGTWQPFEPGAPMQKFSKAPVPAKDAASRLRQMKELARQIRAHETSLPREHGVPSASATSFASSLSPFTVTPTRNPA